MKLFNREKEERSFLAVELLNLLMVVKELMVKVFGQTLTKIS